MGAIAAEELILSRQARSLWAKSDGGEGEAWLPLYVHMADAELIGEKLWQSWLPDATRRILELVAGSPILAETLVRFLCAAHDIGKATPVFQAQPIWAFGSVEAGDLSYKARKAGLRFPSLPSSSGVPGHPIAGMVILERYLASKGWERDVARSYASVIGAHHGRFPISEECRKARTACDEPYGFAVSGEWESVQEELLEFAGQLSGLDDEALDELSRHSLPASVASLVVGIVIMADWMASNQDVFPLQELIAPPTGFADAVDLDALRSRGETAWEALSIAPSWAEGPHLSDADAYFAARFGFPLGAKPHPMQRAAYGLARDATDLGLMLIEAPMGSGKTEAALAAAEMLAARQGLGGVCVALPTMATTDAMFGRVHKWLDRLPCEEGLDEKSVYLAHGKAGLNEEFQGLVSESRRARRFADIGHDLEDASTQGVAVSDWLFGRKRGMLANFVVCTVDQVLMGALQMKHLSLRHLALANKVVIIDECHAYDAYMRRYLLRVLEWLGAWRVPVILLSATLPSAQRKGLCESYLKGREARVPEPSSEDELIAGLLGPRVEDSGEEPDGGGAGARPGGKRERGSEIRQGTEPGLSAGADREGAAAEDAGDSDGKGTSDTGPKATPSFDVSGIMTEEDAYPLLTYTEGRIARSVRIEQGGVAREIDVSLLGDDIAYLLETLSAALANGGCAGVICSTVSRAQEVTECLSEALGPGDVMLTHSRFSDLDRMANEERLRSLLGPRATSENGRRPRRLVVVGTQVLEQSLDIDFDLLVTDVAPVDLVLQRLGRLHRHNRGQGECERSQLLQRPMCLVRGVEEFGTDGPRFSKGICSVYDHASLLESLAVLGLTDDGAHTRVCLPGDISPLVQRAYRGGGDSVPLAWQEAYEQARLAREGQLTRKARRAGTCLLASVVPLMENERTLVDMCERSIEGGGRADADKGQRAVRDTQETVEVLLLQETEGGLCLLPWIGDERNGVDPGSRVPTALEPSADVARLVAQCAVRLPLSMCSLDKLDELIDELEENCGKWTAAWQDSPWLAGRLVLALRQEDGDEFVADVCGWRVSYTRRGGLATVRGIS
ncbi:CRISPR-associated endonuclease Cas3'' [Olsenella uli]|uniref:CRISPR-associated endonuclease Cas3'' n=1 Tax=Olsenella uli TaxID=133926 RepID=UPI0012AB3CD5|nr:CRISPR-associated endonuclease Cas3'' [Olsenella uli]